MKKYLPSLVSGFGASVLSTIPPLKGFSCCCLLVPAAAVVALMLDQRINKNVEKITLKKALLFGFMTGLFAALFITSFDLLITFFTKENEIIQNLPQTEQMMREWNLGPLVNDSIEMIKQMEIEIQTTGFSMLYSVMILFSNLIGNIILGLLGGALGLAILNRRTG